MPKAINNVEQRKFKGASEGLRTFQVVQERLWNTPEMFQRIPGSLKDAAGGLRGVPGGLNGVCRVLRSVSEGVPEDLIGVLKSLWVFQGIKGVSGLSGCPRVVSRASGGF